MSDHVTCSRCSGCGKVELGPELQRTLDFMRAHRRGAVLTREVVMAFPGLSVSAAVNRLTDLRKLRLVKRERLSHKSWLYTPVTTPEWP